MSHLILHKVRGEPAFDIASQIEVDGETWWIIPTSGHRAYPVEAWPMEELKPFLMEGYGKIPDVPNDWPDHFQVRKEQKIELNIGQLISGLVKFKRRF